MISPLTSSIGRGCAQMNATSQISRVPVIHQWQLTAIIDTRCRERIARLLDPYIGQRCRPSARHDTAHWKGRKKFAPHIICNLLAVPSQTIISKGKQVHGWSSRDAAHHLDCARPWAKVARQGCIAARVMRESADQQSWLLVKFPTFPHD